jgi:excisionase family DNA binding protein
MTSLRLIDGGTVEQNTGRKALTMHEVAGLIGVSYQTVRKLIREGSLRSVQVGALVRVPAAALDEFLAGE